MVNAINDEFLFLMALKRAFADIDNIADREIKSIGLIIERNIEKASFPDIVK